MMSVAYTQKSELGRLCTLHNIFIYLGYVIMSQLNTTKSLRVV